MQLPEVHAVITSFTNYGNGLFTTLYKCCLTIYYLSIVAGVIPSIGQVYIATSMNRWLPS